MHLRTIALVFSLLLPVVAWAAASALVHPPQTAQEKVLAAILRRAGNDENIFEFLLNRPWYDASKNSGYDILFSQSLLHKLSQEEATLVKENCGGIYKEGEICGMDYDPITCSQDPPERYAYKTLSQAPNKAVILVTSVVSSYTPIGDYTLIKHGQYWELDAVNCRW